MTGYPEKRAVISGIGISRIGRRTGIPGLELTVEAAKQAGLSLPDQTAQMPRFQEEEMMELARNGSRQDAAANNKNKPAAEKPENPNSSESVEASLEDFISQANASFPTSDGWDLHTGDVELIDDGTGTDVEDASSPKPLIVKPRRAEPLPYGIFARHIPKPPRTL